jgi:aminoglycoside/choline kinase family phosphotransferase
MKNEANGYASSGEIVRKAVVLSAGMPEGGFSADAVALPITGGGSDRKFFRISEGGKSAVLLVDRSKEFVSYVSIGRFLQECGVGVPVFYGTDETEQTVLMEDLGSIHLEEALRGANAEEELSLYRMALELLTTLQSEVTGRMLEAGMLEGRSFDREALIGETDYFRDQFIEQYCPVPLDEGWERERSLLADFLSRQRPVFMHRDFQSRNIHVRRGGLRLVDFQTAHRGPGLYDAASLLRDPYHPLPGGTSLMLAGELYGLLSDAGALPATGLDEFHEGFILAGIQRNLQALAAFVKLGTVKGKKEFLESIPAGLDMLEAGIDESGRFPSMKRMVIAVREKLEKGL